MATGRRMAPGSPAAGGGDHGTVATVDAAAAFADDEPLDPAAGAGWLDEEVQAVAVFVSSWRGAADVRGTSPVRVHRGDNVRIISVRCARKQEIDHYERN